MITKQQAEKLKELINEYCDAKIDYSWVGSYEIEDQTDVEHDVMASLLKLNYFIKELTNEI